MCSGFPGAGAGWCPINPRHEAEENRQLLELSGCRCLIFGKSFAPLMERIADALPQPTTLVCLEKSTDTAPGFEEWLDRDSREPDPVVRPDDEPCALAGTGDTTGCPKEFG